MALRWSRPDMPFYVYGTTRLGDGSIKFDDRVRVARAAIDGGAWLHTSDAYGDALTVLRAAFDVDRAKVPPAIFKIGWESAEQVRGQVVSQLAQVGLDRMEVGQLCPGGGLAEALRTGGSDLDGLIQLKEEGLVGMYVLEAWPWTSENLAASLRGGHAQRVVDGLIFYLNPLQRFVTNDLWDLASDLGMPIVAMRTVAGGDVMRMKAPGGAPEYLQKRAAEVAPIFEHSGVADWPEFCVRFARGFPQVRATVGATSRVENLNAFLGAARHAQPLDAGVQAEIRALHRRWSDEHDRHAAPWSM